MGIGKRKFIFFLHKGGVNEGLKKGQLEAKEWWKVV